MNQVYPSSKASGVSQKEGCSSSRLLHFSYGRLHRTLCCQYFDFHLETLIYSMFWICCGSLHRPILKQIQIIEVAVSEVNNFDYGPPHMDSVSMHWHDDDDPYSCLSQPELVGPHMTWGRCWSLGGHFSKDYTSVRSLN